MAPTEDKKTAAEGSSSSSTAAGANAGVEEAKKSLPQLGALEEDDEFEEVMHRFQHCLRSNEADTDIPFCFIQFEAEGKATSRLCIKRTPNSKLGLTASLSIDWDDSESSLSQITSTINGKSESLNTSTSTTGAGNANASAGAGGAGGKPGTTGMDSLWEDNWDDDDIEDDFSVQLR